MKDRFNLEQDIMAIYSTADDLKSIAEVITDSDQIYDQDRLFNLLYGMGELLDVKAEKLFDTFKQVHRLDNYRNIK